MTQVIGSSNFYIGDHKNLHATLCVETQQSTNGVKNISFECKRFMDGVDERMYSVFINAINGNSHTDMVVDVKCPHNIKTGDCGNKRKHLSECRCEVLDRVKDSTIRHEYEDHVIITILDMLRQKNERPFHLRLAMFCSGRLLGEETLLFRLCHHLWLKKLTGTIEIFLIDTCYDDAIERSDHGSQSLQASSGADYIAQFLEELGQCLPRGITVKGAFFSSSKNYITAASENSNFKHDLLIGADIENSNFDMGEAGRKAGLHSKVAPIVLVKTKPDHLAQESPHVCKLDPVGNLKDCYKPGKGGELHFNNPTPTQTRSSTSTTQRSHRNKSSSGGDTEFILLIGCIAVAALLFLGLSSRSTR